MSDDVIHDDATRLNDAEQLNSFLRANNMMALALGDTPDEYELMDEIIRGAWFDAFVKARELVSEGEGKTYEQLAEVANRAFQCSLNSQSVVPWDDILPEYRLKWGYLIRHTLTLLEWTSDEGPIEAFESQLVEMFRQVFPTVQVPETENATP